MNAITGIPGDVHEDAELVQAARDGNRDAYSQIVARYQALICSLAYSGTGSVARSEDIAQDTFLAAWKTLRELREPATLRAWLCGIARNLISNAHRRSAHEPAEIGAPLDPLREIASLEATPPDQAIREEEEAILWGALGRIPENYREPLILYYRKHRSVVQVAEELGLSEDAAKQRLARGRALLQEQVLAFVEGTLERTGPGPAFTHAVMSAMPVLGASAVAGMAAPAGKASTATKAASSAGGIGFTAAVLGLLGGLAGYIGWQMRDSIAQSPAERRSVDRFWRFAVVGFATFIVPTFLLLVIWGRSQPWIRTVLAWWLGAGYLAIGVPLAVWAWQNHVRIRWQRAEIGAREVPRSLVVIWAALLLTGIGGTVAFGFPSGHWTDLWLEIVFVLIAMPFAVCGWAWTQRRKKRAAESDFGAGGAPAALGTRRWVAAATLGMAALLAVSIFDSGGWRSERIQVGAARDLMATRRDAQIFVLEYQNGERVLSLLVPRTGSPAAKPTRYFSPLDAATWQTLQATGAPYKILRQGEDFEILGWPGRMLLLLSFMVVIAGIVVLAGGLRNRQRLAFIARPAPMAQ